MARNWKCLDHDRRVQMETLLRTGHSKKEVAALLGCHLSTVYREYSRGKCQQRDCHLRDYYVYSVMAAEDRARKNNCSRGRPLKYAADPEIMEYIEARIMRDRYSPATVAAELRTSGRQGPCEDTIYRYARARYFDQLRYGHLPEHGIRKHPVKPSGPKIKPRSLGASIEQRPAVISERSTFGHWEMDTVIGKQSGAGQVFLVMTERYTRFELVFKLPNKESASVVNVLDHLSRRCSFRKIFKSITMDNGAEFASSRKMERLPCGRRRTYCYYCHPYSSWERGSNENSNRLIRRWYPKGRSLAAVTNADCTRLSRWMNTYPRAVLGWKTPSQAFLNACQRENIKISPCFSQYLS